MMPAKRNRIRSASLDISLRPVANASHSPGFTLIELLVVITVIAILASLVFPITAAVNRSKTRARAKAELGMIELAISTYQAKFGHYPPDNPVAVLSASPVYLNQLYYELCGTTLSKGVYTTKDGGTSIRAADVPNAFDAAKPSGFVNSMQGGGSGDEGETSINCFKGVALKPANYADIVNPSTRVPMRVLVCSLGWPVSSPYQPSGTPGSGVNPWRYNSSSPTNNPNSYDLWIDVMVGDKTNRICNWSAQPIIVGAP
jgi:prepilin-type N-terminal cleavage/methylation domain-containing protein